MASKPFDPERWAQRFWSRIHIGAPEECWEWQGCRKRQGYGLLGKKDKLISAHRAAYELAVGPIPKGKSVLHSCDNPPCCNPAHLRVGTNTDNVRDAVARGRHRGFAHGEEHPLAKLTDEQARAARILHAHGMPTKQIADAFGVWPFTIHRILKGDGWTHEEANL